MDAKESNECKRKGPHALLPFPSNSIRTHKQSNPYSVLTVCLTHFPSLSAPHLMWRVSEGDEAELHDEPRGDGTDTSVPSDDNNTPLPPVRRGAGVGAGEVDEPRRRRRPVEPVPRAAVEADVAGVSNAAGAGGT